MNNTEIVLAYWKLSTKVIFMNLKQHISIIDKLDRCATSVVRRSRVWPPFI